MFKKISHDLAECVAKQIRNLLKTSIDKELKGWTEEHILVTEPVPEELWGGKLDYPKTITKVLLFIAHKLDYPKSITKVLLFIAHKLDYPKVITKVLLFISHKLDYPKAITKVLLFNSHKLLFMSNTNLKRPGILKLCPKKP